MSENILLTITMLVSDREDTIEKCMKSLEHLRETVASELIVVDTAGNQFCMDIVRQYTDKIVRFEWCNDFSAARNAGVEKAQGQWLMFLDDDEWFENTKELENFFLSGDYRKYCSAAYKVRSYYDRAGTRWHDTDTIRLVKRVKGTRFVQKVHERIVPMEPPVCYLNDYVHHYGYAYSSPQEENEHSWRNISLLLEHYKEDPKDIHITVQLIQEYMIAKEYSSAVALCRELWMSNGCWDTTFYARYATYAVMQETRAYALQKRYAEGYETGMEMLKQKGISILAKGILYNGMAEFAWKLAKYEEALDYIDQFNTCKREWDQYPDQKSLDTLSQCAQYMSDKEACWLSLLRLHLYVLLEDWEKAEAGLLSVDWQGGDVPVLTETTADVIALLKRDVHGGTVGTALSKKLPYRQEYLSALNALYSNEDIRPDLYAAIDKLESKEKEVLMTYLHHIPPTDVRMCVYHLIYAGNQGDLVAAVTVLEKMQKENYPFFLEDEEYWDSLQKLGVNINQYMTGFGIYRWTETAKRLWDVVELDVSEKIYSCLIRGLEKTDLRYLYISALLMEKKLLEKEKVLTGKDDSLKVMYAAPEIWNELYQTAQYWVACAAMLYREDVFTSDMIKALPPAYQFGWYIMQANAVKQINPGLFIQKVADAAKVYPALKELCKKVIRES